MRAGAPPDVGRAARRQRPAWRHRCGHQPAPRHISRTPSFSLSLSLSRARTAHTPLSLLVCALTSPNRVTRARGPRLKTTTQQKRLPAHIQIGTPPLLSLGEHDDTAGAVRRLIVPCCFGAGCLARCPPLDRSPGVVTRPPMAGLLRLSPPVPGGHSSRSSWTWGSAGATRHPPLRRRLPPRDTSSAPQCSGTQPSHLTCAAPHAKLYGAPVLLRTPHSARAGAPGTRYAIGKKSIAAEVQWWPCGELEDSRDGGPWRLDCARRGERRAR